MCDSCYGVWRKTNCFDFQTRAADANEFFPAFPVKRWTLPSIYRFDNSGPLPALFARRLRRTRRNARYIIYFPSRFKI